MGKYIDKDALVVEIKRLIDCCYKICAGNLDFLQESYPEHYYSIETYKEILSFIDTLEVKEVDLEKEIQDHIRECLDVKFPTTNIELIKKDVAYTAKKFFELGLKEKEDVNITNAFIEKAIDWLSNHVNEYIINDKYILPNGKMNRDWFKVKSDMFEDFKKHMKGE